MKTDRQLQQDVQDELKWDPSVDSAAIGVSARSGVVTLTGNVSTFSQRLAAERISKRVAGVKAIANDIEVRLAGSAERSDSDIAAAALNALKWNSSVPEERIKLTVSHGFVTLEGDLDWHFQKDAAGKAVANLIGVKGVTNAILLKPTTTPHEVRRKIKEAFHRNAELDANSIEIEAEDSKVVLHGKVRSWAEKQEAEKAAWMAPGVTRVRNEITVVP